MKDSLAPARMIGVKEWMDAPATQAVMAALDPDSEAEGRDRAPVALFVGGCVRNALLGLPVGDIDIATILPPDEVTRRLEAAGLKAVPTGLAHGTVTGVAGGRGFEITTLRRDLETDGRHARIGFTADWAEDARRRDFTINTLLADRHGTVYDPLGIGLTDLERRRVVFVGEAEERIAEDYLRILRFFRFFGAYGAGEPDPEALAACREAVAHVGDLSRERVTQETLKILSADDPGRILEMMFSCGILKTLAHKKYQKAALDRLCTLQKQNDLFFLPARVALLSGMDRAHLPRLEKILVLSGRQRSAILGCIEAFEALENGIVNSLKALIYKFGNETALQAVLLSESIDEPPTHHDLVACIGALKNWRAPEFPINGEDILKTGLSPGPKVGAILARAESWWMNQDCRPQREEVLEYMKKLCV